MNAHQVLREIGRINISQTTAIIVKETQHDDQPFVDLRLYFADDNGDFRPTKKGLHLSRIKFLELLNDVLIPYVHQLIQKG